MDEMTKGLALVGTRWYVRFWVGGNRRLYRIQGQKPVPEFGVGIQIAFFVRTGHATLSCVCEEGRV